MLELIVLIFMVVLPILAMMALRNQDVRWTFAIGLGLIPAAFVFFLGILGVLIGAAVVVSYWKIDLPG